MILLLFLYVYIFYRWTKRIAQTTDLRSSRPLFVAAVCLKLSWRMAALTIPLVFVVGMLAGMAAQPAYAQRAAYSAAQGAMVIAFTGFCLSLILSIFVALNKFRSRLRDRRIPVTG